MAPSFTGRGGGWVVSNAADAVRRSTRPTASLIPPPVPLAPHGGAVGEALWAHSGARAISLSRASQRSEDAHQSERRRLRGRRDSFAGAADEPVLPDWGGPASGVAGDRSDGLAAEAARDRREEADWRSGRQAGSFTRSVKGTSPRSPGTGRAALASHSQQPVGSALGRFAPGYGLRRDLVPSKLERRFADLGRQLQRRASR